MSLLSRIDSSETLINDDSQSLITSTSGQTATNELFQQSIDSYKQHRLSIVSPFLQSDSLVFKNPNDLNQYLYEKDSHEESFPLLQTSSSIINYFKPNSPFLIINRFQSQHQKYEFCRVYFKKLEKNLTCYTLIFNIDNENKVLVLLNNELIPSVDFFWENVNFRTVGTTGATSTFGNGLIKLYLVQNDYNLLSDDVVIDYDSPVSMKAVKIKLPVDNELINNLTRTNKPFVQSNLTDTKLLFNLPYAIFMDTHERLNKTKFNKSGEIRLFDYDDNISEHGLIMLCVLLTLREQESRKNKGNNKPTYVN